MLALLIFASPDLSGGGMAWVTTAALLPIFVISALHGVDVWLAIFQVILLGLGEALQWQLTKKERPLLRASSFAATYLFVNLGYSSAVFLCWQFPQKTGLVFLTAGIVTVFLITLIFRVRIRP
jgi:nucleoside permease NupC